MASITFCAPPAPGHINPMLGVASEMVRRGHHVSFLAPARFADQVTATGAEHVPVPSVADSADVKVPDVTTSKGAGQAIRLLLAEAKTVLPAVADLPRPDLVVSGCAAAVMWAPVLAKRWGVPWAEIWPIMANNEHWSVRTDYVKLPVTPSLLLPALRMGAFLRRHGIRGGMAFAHGAHAALRIAMIPRVLQFRGETFDDWVFAGPELADRDTLAHWGPEYERPLVLVTAGTTFTDQPEFFRTVIESAAGRDWQVIIANADLDPATLGPLPPNVELHAHVPQLAVLRKASAFVTHGGPGSVLEALYHRVPMVAVPHIASARPYTDRIVELGLARQLAPGEVTADSLWSAIEDVAADPAVRERLAWMRGELDAAGGGVAAVDAIEKLLADSVGTA